MRVRRLVVLLFFVSLLPLAASAQQPSLTVSPTRFQPFDEAFLTVFISGLSTTDLITVTMSGPAGTFTREPNYVDASKLIVWVPQPILQVEGQYSVNVTVTRSTGVLQFGPGFFSVAGVPQDQSPPQLSYPEVVVADATGTNGAVVQFSVTSHDASPVTCTPPSGSQFPLGPTTVVCSATNAFGSTQISLTVLVIDTISPVITVPDDITTDNPRVTFTVTATDNLDPSPDVFCFPGSGQTFPQGTTNVFCFAIDNFANFAFDSFKVTVTVPGAPILSLPEDMVVEATSAFGTPVTFTVTATENGSVTCTPASGSLFPLGTTEVSCTATNANGSTSGTFLVTVKDTLPPMILNATPSPKELWPPDHKMVEVTVVMNVFDLGDPEPVCTIIEVTSNQPENGGGDGDTAPDWEITGPLTANLRAERTGTADRTYKITVQCVDSSGNFAVRKAEVKVPQSKRRAS